MGWWSGTGPEIKSKITNPIQYWQGIGFGNYLYEQMGKGLPTYPGAENLSEMSAPERSGMGLLESYVNGEAPLSNATNRMIYGILTGEPGYLQAIEGPIQRELNTITLPSIRAAYGKGGTYFGTQRATAEKEAAEAASAGVLEQAVKLLPEALSMGAAIEPGMVETSQKYGGLPRTLEQAKYQEWLRTQPEYNPMLGELEKYLSTESPGLTTTASPGYAGMAANVGNCCFIFIKGNRFLKSVRNFRDKHFGPDSYVAKGYRKMAKWLVPAMDNKWIYKLVKTVMVDPMSNFTEYREKGSHRDTYLVPICAFWIAVWWLYGRFNRQTDESSLQPLDGKVNARTADVVALATSNAQSVVAT